MKRFTSRPKNTASACVPAVMRLVLDAYSRLVKRGMGVAMSLLSGGVFAIHPAITIMPDGAFTLHWQTISNVTYFVESADSIQHEFETLGFGIDGDGSEMAYQDPRSGCVSRFYRVREISDGAAVYRAKAGGLEASVIRDVDAWFVGLERLGLLSNFVWQASLRSRFHGIREGACICMAGDEGRIQGSPIGDETGLHFSGNEWIEFPNPLPSPDGRATHFSILSDFNADPGAVRTLVSSDKTGARGPALVAGGSRTQGDDPEDLFFDITMDGVHSLPNPSASGRRTYNLGNTGSQEFCMAGWNESELSLRTDIDRVYSSPNTFGDAWNGNASWRIGAQLDGGYGFVGTISFAAVLNRVLYSGEYADVRRLYYSTLGKGLARPVNIILEGDSLTEEGKETSWGEYLMTRSNWKCRANKLNVARGGETSGQMYYEFDYQVRPYAHEPGRNYLFIWAGANDLGSSTGSSLFSRLHLYWRQARDAGFRVVAFTLTPTASDSPGGKAERELANRLIRSASNEYDHLIDVVSLPQLRDPEDLAYFLPDGVHLRSSGYLLLAELINQVIPSP